MRADPHDQLARIAAWKRRLHATRLLLALLVLLALSSLIGATVTASLRALYLHIALWFFGQLVAILGVLLGLRALRRRRHGAAPSPLVRHLGDVLLYIGALGGLLALLGFVPRLLGPAAEAVDWVIAGLGLVLLAAGLRAAILYVLRP